MKKGGCEGGKSTGVEATFQVTCFCFGLSYLSMIIKMLPNVPEFSAEGGGKSLHP